MEKHHGYGGGFDERWMAEKTQVRWDGAAVEDVRLEDLAVRQGFRTSPASIYRLLGNNVSHTA